jgi:phosphatidylinositol 4-phosphatase
MRFENVSRLVAGVEDVLRDMRYTWIDSHGVICQQQITFRVNCIDCLDRTNIVQVKFNLIKIKKSAAIQWRCSMLP